MFESLEGKPEPGGGSAVLDHEEVVVGEAKPIVEEGGEYARSRLEGKPGDVDLCGRPTAKVPYPGVYVVPNPTCEVPDAERMLTNFGRYPLMRIAPTLFAGK